MGHAIGGGFLKATTKEAALKEGYADACEFAYINVDREENYDGSYHNSFRFYDKIFNNEDEAMDFFKSLGSYNDGIVMVKEAGKGAKNRRAKKIESINKKKRDFMAKAIEQFKTRTSKTIGCKKCGTRIPSETALKRNLRCPNCNNLLLSESAQKRFSKFDEQLKLVEEQYKKDCAETGKPRYYAKYEVHT